MPAFQVDLGEVYSVYSVNLFHRTDCCQDRLLNAHIIVSQSANYNAGGQDCWVSG